MTDDFFDPRAAGGSLFDRGLANDAQAAAQTARSDVEFLRHEVDRLYLVTEALWRLLKDEHGYADASLAQLVAAIGAEHARERSNPEGRPQPPCEKCGRQLGRRQPKCIWCGAERILDVFGR